MEDENLKKQLFERIPFGFSNKLLTPYEELIVTVRQTNYIRPLLSGEGTINPFLNEKLLSWCLALRGQDRIGQSGYRSALKTLGGIMMLPTQALMMCTLRSTQLELLVQKNIIRVKKRLNKNEFYKTLNYEAYHELLKNESFLEMKAELCTLSKKNIKSLKQFNSEMLKLVL